MVDVLMRLVHQGEALRKNLIELAKVRVVRHADLAGRDRFVAGAVLEIADVRIVDHLEVAAGVLDRRRAHADIADHTAEIVQNDDVAVNILPLKDDERPCDNVLDQALRAKSQNQADDSDARQDRCCVDAQDRKSPDRADDHDQVVECARGQVCDRLRSHALFAKIQHDPLNYHIDDKENADRKDQGQNMGQRYFSAPLDQKMGLFQLTDRFLCLRGQRKPLRIEQQNDQYDSNQCSDHRRFLFHCLCILLSIVG